MSGRVFWNTSSPKFIVPRFKVPISAPSTSEPSRSSTDMPTAPPVEHWTTTSLPASRMRSMISRKCSGRWDGRPSGQRACRWTAAAPARHASTAACAISAGVYGTAGFCSRVTSAPTTAAVMITFSAISLASSSHGGCAPASPTHRRVPRTPARSARLIRLRLRSRAPAAGSRAPPRAASPLTRWRPGGLASLVDCLRS